MKRKQYIASLLFIISMMMTVIPVIPHHHHADGLICMKNDLAADCCEHHHAPFDRHCCCNTGCMTAHFVQQTPHSDEADLQPGALWTITLFFESLSKLLFLPEFDIQRQESLFLEPLHGTFITCATGLRAPPSPWA